LHEKTAFQLLNERPHGKKSSLESRKWRKGVYFKKQFHHSLLHYTKPTKAEVNKSTCWLRLQGLTAPLDSDSTLAFCDLTLVETLMAPVAQQRI